MSFPTPSGPPATERQLAYLADLLRGAGYTSFGDARRPLGLTAKQAKGKFTKPEASALIERLTGEDEAVDGVDVPPAIAAAPDDVLVAELTRRGWGLTPPRSSGGARRA